MPWANCVSPQCGACRRQKLSIFKHPNRESDFHEEWRTKILNILIKYRVKDDKLKEKIKAGTVTAQNMKFSIKAFFSKCDQIRSFRRI